MVAAQLVEWLLPTPENPSSNPASRNVYQVLLFTVNCIEKAKIRKKKPEMAHKEYLKAHYRCDATIAQWHAFVSPYPTMQVRILTQCLS